MAWRCSGATNAELIQNLCDKGLITSPRVRDAMLKVDRAHYVLPSRLREAYTDAPSPLGHAATISAPHMHALAAEALLPHLRPGSRVLDVGSGSGYLTHVLAELVRPGGVVVGVEHVPELVGMAGGNVARSEAGRGLVAEGGVRFVLGDGRRGWRGEGFGGADGREGWDAIHVGAATGGWLEEIVAQLGRPGGLFVPVDEGGRQHIWVVERGEDGEVTRERRMGVKYVPLTGRGE